jgi:hypothetical protein
MPSSTPDMTGCDQHTEECVTALLPVSFATLLSMIGLQQAQQHAASHSGSSCIDT